MSHVLFEGAVDALGASLVLAAALGLRQIPAVRTSTGWRFAGVVVLLFALAYVVEFRIIPAVAP